MPKQVAGKSQISVEDGLRLQLFNPATLPCSFFSCYPSIDTGYPIYTFVHSLEIRLIRDLVHSFHRGHPCKQYTRHDITESTIASLHLHSLGLYPELLPNLNHLPSRDARDKQAAQGYTSVTARPTTGYKQQGYQTCTRPENTQSLLPEDLYDYTRCHQQQFKIRYSSIYSRDTSHPATPNHNTTSIYQETRRRTRPTVFEATITNKRASHASSPDPRTWRQKNKDSNTHKMAVPRDPNFWRRFSTAVHLDEEAQVTHKYAFPANFTPLLPFSLYFLSNPLSSPPSLSPLLLSSPPSLKLPC
jgi:hypothetical protein